MNTHSVAVIADPIFADELLPREYKGGPGKVLAVNEALRSNRFPFEFSFSGEHRLPKECFLEPVQASATDLTNIHPEEYLERLQRLCHTLEHSSSGGIEPFQYNQYGTPDLNTLVSSRAFEIMRYGIGSIKHALDLISDGTLEKVFTVKAYMGHHAEAERAMGFCILNSAAIAAEYALQKDPLARIAIIDWDIHHGNGTQHIFENDPRVFYGSIHQDSLFPRQSGSPFERGIGEGIDTTLNLPLPGGTTAEQYGRAFDKLLNAVEQFNPDLIIIECGFDACQGDSLGRFLLQPHHFRVLTSKVVNLSERVAARGKILSILAGGYTPKTVGDAAIRHVQALFDPEKDLESLRMR